MEGTYVVKLIIESQKVTLCIENKKFWNKLRPFIKFPEISVKRGEQARGNIPPRHEHRNGATYEANCCSAV
jgi:hypothetical protein